MCSQVEPVNIFKTDELGLQSCHGCQVIYASITPEEQDWNDTTDLEPKKEELNETMDSELNKEAWDDSMDVRPKKEDWNDGMDSEPKKEDWNDTMDLLFKGMEGNVNIQQFLKEQKRKTTESEHKSCGIEEFATTTDGTEESFEKKVVRMFGRD
jgi:hypothetical protein